MRSVVNPKRSIRGFTLVELMVVITVLVILMAVGIPSMRSMIENQRARSISGELHSALTLARSEAIKRNTNVTITPENNKWIDGWKVSIGTRVIDEVSAISGTTIDGPTSVTFQSSGRISAGNDAQFKVTAGAYARCVHIGLSGRTSVQSC